MVMIGMMTTIMVTKMIMIIIKTSKWLLLRRVVKIATWLLLRHDHFTSSTMLTRNFNISYVWCLFRLWEYFCLFFPQTFLPTLAVSIKTFFQICTVFKQTVHINSLRGAIVVFAAYSVCGWISVAYYYYHWDLQPNKGLRQLYKK